MRGFKITFGLALLLVSALITVACYVQSHGAGIGTGSLLAIVITAYVYDHRHHLLGQTDGNAFADRSNATKIAMHQGRLTAMRHDGDISAR
jgi:UDP-N-acetylmuramoylalanine-D-glutamate ligase